MDIKFIKKERKSGKTTAAVERLKVNDNSLMIVHHQSIKKDIENIDRSFRNRVFMRSELRRAMEGRQFNEVIVDELPSDQEDFYYFMKELEGKFHNCSAMYSNRNIVLYYS